MITGVRCVRHGRHGVTSIGHASIQFPPFCWLQLRLWLRLRLWPAPAVLSPSALLHRWLPRWFYLEENLGFGGHCYILWGGLDPHGQKWSLKQDRPWPLLHLGRWSRTRNIKTRILLLLPHSATPCQWSSRQSGPMTVQLGWAGAWLHVSPLSE